MFSSEEVATSTSQVKDHTNNANNVCVWHKKVFNTKWFFKNYNLQALKPKGKNPIHGMNPYTLPNEMDGKFRCDGKISLCHELGWCEVPVFWRWFYFQCLDSREASGWRLKMKHISHCLELIWDMSEQLIKFTPSTARGATSYFKTILNCHKCICRIFTPNTQKPNSIFKKYNMKSPLSLRENSSFAMHLKIMRAKTENNGFTHMF